MRILGPALITATQQKMLATDALLEISRSAVYMRASARPGMGDAFWVREPYWEWIPPTNGVPSNLDTILYGSSPVGLNIPDRLKHYFSKGTLRRCSASTLAKKQSRASLEIVGALADGWRCKARMGNVDGIESDAA